jgi:ABC-type sugar transport system substrate-binding protein
MDPAKQASQIEDFVAQRAVALIVAPCDSDAVGAHLAAAEKAGIPVFTADIAARSGRVVSHVASDNVQGGRLAAQALAGFIGGKGKVVIIDHPTVASVQDRTRGFEEELAKHPGVVIAGRLSSDGQRAKAMAAMEDMLQAHRDLAGVFGINDDSALGAVAVLEAAGRRDVALVGFDATPEARRAIRAGGPLKADVAQHPKVIGRKVVELVARHLAGEPVPPIVAVEVELVDQGTLARP